MTSVAVNDTEDPLVVFQFELDVQGKATGFFTEVSGGKRTIEATEHKIVSPTGIQMIKKVPGRAKWEPIKLKRAITSAMDLWVWRKEVEEGNIGSARANGTLSALNQAGDVVAEWTFDKGWPSKLEGPTPKSDGDEFAMEEVTLEIEGFRRTK